MTVGLETKNKVKFKNYYIIIYENMVLSKLSHQIIVWNVFYSFYLIKKLWRYVGLVILCVDPRKFNKKLNLLKRFIKLTKIT